MSSPKQNKSAIVHLLTATSNNPKFVPPVLRDVGKLAAGVASVSTTTASATGNPRNKCALLPGHSLMDWIRLGNSGKDLTGVGSQAGQLAVTRTELAKHNKLTDAWLAIRGKVYNVTAYLPFHPGGPEELMRGVGKDATSLFDEVHPWVNYESILQKCLVGRLVLLSPSINPEELFNSGLDKPPPRKQTTIEVKSPTSEELPKIEVPDEETPEKIVENDETILPKFDWIQKMNQISLVFYTAPLSNPSVELQKIEETVHITLCYSNRTYLNEIVFFKDTQWPCEIKVNYETGKIECVFRKTEGEIWNNYGVLKQKSRVSGNFSARNKISYVVSRKIQVASNIFLLELDRTDGVHIVVPITYHVRIFAESGDTNTSRSYTPIPACLFSQLGPQKHSTDTVCLMVKRYPDGYMSRYVSDAIKGDVLHLSKPLFGGFSLSDVEKKEIFLLLAAGTGITPMLSIIVFLLERRVRKSHSIRLIFCNRKATQIPFKQHFEELALKEKRFAVDHILSDPDEEWQGKTGHITKEVIEKTIEEQLSGANYPKLDLSVFVCGSVAFNELCWDLLTELDIQKEQINVFQG